MQKASSVSFGGGRQGSPRACPKRFAHVPSRPALCWHPAAGTEEPGGRCSPSAVLAIVTPLPQAPQPNGPPRLQKVLEERKLGNVEESAKPECHSVLCSHTEQASATESQDTKGINNRRAYNILIKNNSMKANCNQSKYYFLKIQHSARRKV